MTRVYSSKSHGHYIILIQRIIYLWSDQFYQRCIQSFPWKYTCPMHILNVDNSKRLPTEYPSKPVYQLILPFLYINIIKESLKACTCIILPYIHILYLIRIKEIQVQYVKIKQTKVCLMYCSRSFTFFPLKISHITRSHLHVIRGATKPSQ